MLTVCLGGLVIVLAAAAALLFAGRSTLHTVVTVTTDTQVAPRPFVTGFRRCTSCGRDTLASLHADDRYTCLTCITPHTPAVTP